MAAKLFMEKETTSWLEKFLYGLGGIGGNLCWTFMALFITVYYTNSAGIAAGVVGTFMLVSRVFDGVSDIIFSAIIQKAHFRSGKIKPWFLISAPMLGACILLCFNVPSGLPVAGRGIYAFVTYSLTAAIAYTIFNLAFASFLPLISYDDADRSITSTVGNVLIFSGVAFINLATPILLAMGGGENSQGAWTRISIIYAILSTLFVALMAVIKEKEVPAEIEEACKTDTEAAAEEERLGFKEALGYVLKTKYTWILLSFYLLFTFYSGTAGIGYYNFMYVIQDTSMFGVSATAGTVATIICFFFVPKMFKKWGKQRTIMAAMTIFAAAGLFIYINPRNILLVTVITVIKSFVSAPISVVQFVFVADLTDYLLKKYKVQIGHVVAMTSSVGIKVGTGLGSAAVGWGLQIVGFNAMEAMQSSFTQNGIIFITAVLPTICAVIMVILMGFWDLDKKNGEAV